MSTELPSRCIGYSLLELLTTLSVAAILTTVAVPGLRTFVQNNRAAAQTNELVTALNLARSEAVARGEAASICASVDGVSCSSDSEWAAGWLVFVDRIAPLGTFDSGPDEDVLLRVYPALEGGTALAGSVPAVTYGSNGFLAAAAAATFQLRIPDCRGSQARDITVNLPGRTAVTHVDC